MFFFRPNKILQVYLNNNGVTLISRSLLDFENAELIQIEGNPIVCNCEMVKIHFIKKIWNLIFVRAILIKLTFKIFSMIAIWSEYCHTENKIFCGAQSYQQIFFCFLAKFSCCVFIKYLCKNFQESAPVSCTEKILFYRKNLRFQKFLAFYRRIFRSEIILDKIKPRKRH